MSEEYAERKSEYVKKLEIELKRKFPEMTVTHTEQPPRDVPEAVKGLTAGTYDYKTKKWSDENGNSEA